MTSWRRWECRIWWLFQQGWPCYNTECRYKQQNTSVILNNVKSMSQWAVIESIDNLNPLLTMIESGSKGSFVNLG